MRQASTFVKRCKKVQRGESAQAVRDAGCSAPAHAHGGAFGREGRQSLEPSCLTFLRERGPSGRTPSPLY